MYIWVAVPIWRRLLMSFTIFARSRALLRDGIAIAARIVIIAITTSNSSRVKARSTGGGELLAMDIGVRCGSYCPSSGSESEKEPQKHVCLTRDFAFGVCRSCPSKSLSHLRLRPARAPSLGQSQHQPVYLRTWLRQSPAFH